MTVVSERLPISVFDAFCIVVAAGGCKALTDSKRWPVATHAILAPRPPPPGMPLHMRHLYEMYIEVRMPASRTCYEILLLCVLTYFLHMRIATWLEFSVCQLRQLTPCCTGSMQGFEAFAQDTLLQGFSVPSSAHDALQSAEAKLTPPAVRQASDDSGASGDQRVRHHRSVQHIR